MWGKTTIQALLQTAPIFTRIRFRFKFMNIIYRLFTNDDDEDRCYSFTLLGRGTTQGGQLVTLWLGSLMALSVCPVVVGIWSTLRMNGMRIGNCHNLVVVNVTILMGKRNLIPLAGRIFLPGCSLLKATRFIGVVSVCVFERVDLLKLV